MATRATRLAVLVLLALAGTAAAQPAPQHLTVGIYAPSVEFGTAQARLSYLQGLAKAIEQNTGIKTEAQSYGSLGALIRGDVDFAIVDGPCYSIHLGWRLLANAVVGGGTTRAWALFSSTGGSMQALHGTKLAYMKTGCDDAGFIDNAMLASEVDASFFAARVGKPDLSAAVAEVASYKAAQAVFAPIGVARGLHKVFDTGAVPNPAFVAISTKLPSSVVGKVASAVLGYGGGGAIASWARPSREPYQALASRLGKVVKAPILATPEPVRIDAKDVLADPASVREPAFVPVRHHFVHAGARME